MVVGGRFVIDDELRLLIYMAASRALAALTFSHIWICFKSFEALNQVCMIKLPSV